MIKVLLQTACAENWAIPGLQRVDYQSAVDGFRDWALIYPNARRETWIIVIHGHGAHGDQLYTRRDIREAWLPHFQESDAGILTVNLRNNAWMSAAAVADLHDLLQWLRTEYGMRKTLFFSGSMGGTSNLIYGALHPQDVNGIVSLGAATDIESYYLWCQNHLEKAVLADIARAIETAYEKNRDGWKERLQRHSALRNIEKFSAPIYFAHGGADEIIPVEQARHFTAAMAEISRDKKYFSYHEIPRGNHDSPLWDAGAWEFARRILADD